MKRVAAGVAVVAVLLLGYWVLVPRDYYTGTNSVRLRGTLIELNDTARELCLPGLEIPAGTGRLELHVDTPGNPRPPLAMTLAGHTSRLGPGPPGMQKIAFAFPETSRAQVAEACIRLAGSGPVVFGGVPRIPAGEQAPEVDGAAVDARPAIWYRPPEGEKASILSRLPALFERMAVFRPEWVGAWTYWLIYLVLAPALALAGIWLLLTPERRRLALLVGALGFGQAAVWANVTPAFNSPDESEHFAYVQSLAERGKPLEVGQTERPTYSSQQRLALDLTRIHDSNETADGKPVWRESQEDLFRELVAARDLRDDDGGGFATAGSSHTPLYYGLAVPAYLAAGGDVFSQLLATRLVSALLGGLVALCAVLIVLELAPRRRGLAAAAGVAVAFQPMFAFMSGSVNNDMGVNAAAAVSTLLLVRLLRRGFHWPTAIGLGVAVGLAPLLKGTGYAMFPPAALALALFAWRYRAHWRKVALVIGAVVGGVLAVSLIWSAASGLFDRGSFATPGGTVPGEGAPALTQPGGTLVYIWEIFLPQLPGMNEHWTQSWPAYDIFGLRGWGAFGWYALTWHHDVYWVIMILLVALTALGLWTLVRRLPRELIPEVLVLAAVVATVIGVMTAAYYSPTPQGDLYPIQGRYVFPAIGALAALFVGSTVGAGRFAGALRVGLATAVVCLGYASLWLVLGGFYFAA